MPAWLEIQSQLEPKAVGMPRNGQVGGESQLGTASAGTETAAKGRDSGRPEIRGGENSVRRSAMAEPGSGVGAVLLGWGNLP